MNFFELTPDRVLSAVEESGILCTGRCMALNSFENRVYDVELEEPLNTSSQRNRVVAKFYRPGRWTIEQILEEHEFLEDLVKSEIPAIAPSRFPNGSTVVQSPNSHIYYSLFPKVGGRAPDELSDDQLLRIGRLLGRIHNVGATKKSLHRIRLDQDTYGHANLSILLKESWIPLEFKRRYQDSVEKICKIAKPLFSSTDFQRIHGDCHLGNLLWNDNGPFFLDFDDMVCGPPVQDIWLLVPGRDDFSYAQRNRLLKGYLEMRHFDKSSLRLIEPLRALRIVHYSTWIAKRWTDPAFPAAFPQFMTHQYWSEEVEELERLVHICSKSAESVDFV